MVSLMQDLMDEEVKTWLLKAGQFFEMQREQNNK